MIKGLVTSKDGEGQAAAVQTATVKLLNRVLNFLFLF